MTRDIPAADKILEELADKTSEQIERLAAVAFNDTFREMTRYHSFLLALSASSTPNGKAFSYSDITGYAWNAPHQDWIRRYGRLFERAADRLPDDGQFLRSLAYTPDRLLPGPGDPELPPSVIKAILDLGPMMMHRIEAWITKRTTVETREGQAANPRLLLAGSDTAAYVAVLPDIVGAWEGLLNSVPSMYGWPEAGTQKEAERWAALRASWPFLWHHLSNTARCLALAVWNEDERGAAMFREALVRWPQVLNHHLNERAQVRDRRLLFPDVLKLNWPEASEQVARLADDFEPTLTPDQVFVSVLRGAHDDAVTLTAALLLYWTINEKQVSDIGGETAKSLLRREGGDDFRPRTPGESELGFRSRFLDVLRLRLSGERHREGSYAADLDRLVRDLDGMTERRVVPWRIFTPSTLHGKDELLISMVAMLVAATPDDDDNGLGERIEKLAREEVLLPEGDRSLRNAIDELGRFRSALEHSWPKVACGFALLEPDRDAEHLQVRFLEIVTTATASIESDRLKRLEARSVDPDKLERIRLSVETALLNEPATLNYFRGVDVRSVAHNGQEKMKEFVFGGIAKAQLTDPPMETPVLNYEQRFASSACTQSWYHIWSAFCGRKRTEVVVSTGADEEVFWREIAPLVDQAGPNPVLVVSISAEGRSLRRRIRAAPPDRLNLATEMLPRADRDHHYIATVEGVDVYGADFESGEAWLFSAEALRSIAYGELDRQGRYVDAAYEAVDAIKGNVRVRFSQILVWSDQPIFELRAPNLRQDQ